MWISPEPAVAIIIHEVATLPSEFMNLKFQPLPEFAGTSLILFRFPYKVYEKEIKRSIDLRLPEVRDWFYIQFRDTLHMEYGQQIALPDPTIAYSRFHLENGRAPTPSSFWHMLPTLMNPNLGGGNAGTTGSTLFVLAHWMRQNDIDAFIYPSARSDVSVLYENKNLVNFSGWNLIDYRECDLMENTDISTFDGSPWAWVQFPKGVKLHIAEAGEHEGSFAVQGMVAYSAQEYKLQIKALETARAVYGHEIDISNPFSAKKYRVFAIGMLFMRWLREVSSRSLQQIVDEKVLELEGLALPYDISVGRIRELWSGIAERTIEFGNAYDESLKASGRVSHHLANQDEIELGNLVRLGTELEISLLALTLGDNKPDPSPLSNLLMPDNENNWALECLNAKLATEIDQFFKIVKITLVSSFDKKVLMETGGKLINDISHMICSAE